MNSNGVYIIASCGAESYGGATVTTWLWQTSLKAPFVMALIRSRSQVLNCLAKSRRAVIFVVASNQKHGAPALLECNVSQVFDEIGDQVLVIFELAKRRLHL
jgi:flavin reductase (DIM6/NTAB) family NADH-FMN oxidoreductase RutF